MKNIKNHKINIEYSLRYARNNLHLLRHGLYIVMSIYSKNSIPNYPRASNPLLNLTLIGGMTTVGNYILNHKQNQNSKIFHIIKNINEIIIIKKTTFSKIDLINSTE
jgi:hypothetical protein